MNDINIKVLASTFIENYTEEDVPNSIYEEYSKKIAKYKEYIGIGSRYFFGHLHDSKIISCKNNNGNLYLKLNEMATLQFACALIDKLKLNINKSKIIFPLEISSENTSHLSLNIVDTNGKIIENNFIKVSEYLYEEIIEWTDVNIKIAFDLWTNKIKPYRYLLLLSCRKINILENQKIHWNNYFGNEYDKYYDIFLEERKKGIYLSDYSICLKFMEKIIQ
jgi:hypothetical protein